MNNDQLKGKWMQFKGELKKKWGKFTDDDLKMIEGDYDKFAGKVQEHYGDKKEEVLKCPYLGPPLAAPNNTAHGGALGRCARRGGGRGAGRGRRSPPRRLGNVARGSCPGNGLLGIMAACDA